MAKSPLAICLLSIIVASSTLYEAQGHFLLNDYLKNFPSTSSEFKPFAFKGMISFVDGLEGLCPVKEEYKKFFTELKAFMTFLNSASGSSSEFNSKLKAQSEGLFKAISTLSGKAGSPGGTSKLIETLTSMGKTLAGYKRTGSQTITSEQREKLKETMVKWAKGIGEFVKKVGEKSGDGDIDLSSLGFGGGSSDSGSPGGSPSDSSGSSGASSIGGGTSDAAGPSGSPTDSSAGESSMGGGNDTETQDASGGPSGSTSDMSTEGRSMMGGGSGSSMSDGGSYSDTTGGSTIISTVGVPPNLISGESSYTGSGSPSYQPGGAPVGCN
ncbi:unnamed protein product [Eruca vesicaria subsp. sativa]|uniref:DUF1216 domain-containing protein n=1 Tax=Eruca vesicaria subsp. sativa TaxID=29727 RepID=A0ABC8LNE9_ERUVS|nr:unnamed protein product [Eruca vesicaria subsp. sativa]